MARAKAAASVLLVLLTATQSHADVSANARITETMSMFGGSFVNSINFSFNLTFTQTQGRSASVTGTTPALGSDPSGVRVQGVLSVCDYGDWNPCFTESVDAPAPGAVFGLLGNSFEFQGYLPTNALGPVPASFSVSRPASSYLNPSNGQAPNAWIEGTTVHADSQTWSSFARQGYVASASIDNHTASYVTTWYQMQVTTELEAEN